MIQICKACPPKLFKEKLLCTIQVGSQNIRELRELVLKKKRALQLLLQKVDGDWKSSNFASSISYLKTKVIQCSSCIHSLLETIDRIGLILSHINGTSDMYVFGSGNILDLSHQKNFCCLKKFSEEIYDNLDSMESSHLIKQHSNHWHQLRKKAIVTGST